MGSFVKIKYSFLAVGRGNASGSDGFCDLIFRDEWMFLWNFCHFAGVFLPGDGVLLHKGYNFCGIRGPKAHDLIFPVIGSLQVIELFHDDTIVFGIRQKSPYLLHFVRKTTPKITDDAHIAVVGSFVVNIPCHIDELFCQLLLFKGTHFSQFHITGKAALIQKLSDPGIHILPGYYLSISGIPGRVTVGNVHTIPGIPSTYLGISEFQAVAAVIGLFDEG